ncbi:hypothetical protein D0Z00_000404 [Geotrichum galactomycetum]|uniref:Uncharacterized protein n=1 Tax=Geotrichum galactomycetum TaxID=27317 RepID=A0ACB6VA76_9ASCO|nr:hypothetical protein D0Z00_000404 [Geotrichum candidum]
MSGLFSVYPPPPPYYKYFTQENIDKLAKFKETEAASNILLPSDQPTPLEKEDASAPSSSNIKDHFPLEYLVPPEPPAEGPYRSFGEIWQTEDKLPTLSDTGIKQLYSNSEGNQDRIFELKKLLHSLLIQFIELAGIMSISPESFPAKIEDIRVLLINMHHLLNEYRPHQSRESLILLMESQLEDKRREIADLKQKNEQVQHKVADLTKQFDSVLLEKNEKGGASSNNNASRRKSRTTSVVEERVDDAEEGKKQSVDDLQWQLLDFQPT